MVAVYLGNRPLPPKISETFIAIAMIIVPTLLVAIQPDLGTSILVSASGLFVVFLAGMSWWLILAAVVGLAAFIPIMWMYLMHDYQRMRVLTLLDPKKDPLGAGYHICNQNCHRFRRYIWQRMDARDTIPIRIFA